MRPLTSTTGRPRLRPCPLSVRPAPLKPWGSQTACACSASSMRTPWNVRVPKSLRVLAACPLPVAAGACLTSRMNPSREDVAFQQVWVCWCYGLSASPVRPAGLLAVALVKDSALPGVTAHKVHVGCNSNFMAILILHAILHGICKLSACLNAYHTPHSSSLLLLRPAQRLVPDLHEDLSNSKAGSQPQLWNVP